MGRKENKVEAYLQKRVTELGGFTRKVTYQGRAGAPDQWCFFPGGRLLIVECKAEDGTLDALQAQEILKLRAQGFEAHVAHTKDEVDIIVEQFLNDNPDRTKKYLMQYDDYLQGIAA
jgi:hypothetical protein